MLGKKIYLFLVSMGFLYISSPFIVPVVMAVMLSVLFYPFRVRLDKKHIPRALSAGLLTTGITVLFIFPISFLLFFSVKATFNQLQPLKNTIYSRNNVFETLMAAPKMNQFATWITQHFPLSMQEIKESLPGFALIVGTKIKDFLGEILSHVPDIIMTIVVVILSIYFLLLEGEKILNFFQKHSIFSPSQTKRLMDTMKTMCRSVLLAAVISGVAQASLFMIFGLIMHTPHVILIGILVFLTSFIPVVGCFPIPILIGIQNFLEGARGTGGVFFILVILLMILDSIVRSLFLKESVGLHPLIAFISALGGLKTIGFVGVFIGPIFASLFLMSIQILIEMPNPS